MLNARPALSALVVLSCGFESAGGAHPRDFHLRATETAGVFGSGLDLDLPGNRHDDRQSRGLPMELESVVGAEEMLQPGARRERKPESRCARRIVRREVSR